MLHKRLRHARLIEADIMEAARSSQGIETLDQIKFAILERNGKISVIAQESSDFEACALNEILSVGANLRRKADNITLVSRRLAPTGRVKQWFKASVCRP